MRSIKSTSVLASLVVGSSLLVAACGGTGPGDPSAAQAESSERQPRDHRPICNAYNYYELTSIQSSFIPGSIVYTGHNESNVTQEITVADAVTVTAQETVSVSYTASGGGGIEFPLDIIKISINAGVQSQTGKAVMEGVTGSTTIGADVTVPPHMYGHAQAGAFSYKTTGQFHHVSDDCVDTLVAYVDTANSPRDDIGWTIWVNDSAD